MCAASGTYVLSFQVNMLIIPHRLRGAPIRYAAQQLKVEGEEQIASPLRVWGDLSRHTVEHEWCSKDKLNLLLFTEHMCSLRLVE